MGGRMNSPQLARSFRWILITLSLFLSTLPHMSAQNLPTLELKRSVERTLVAQETHTYRIYARADQYLQFDVQPQATALTASLLSPAGETIAELVNRPGGVRLVRISAQSTVDGYYRFQITTSGQIKGKYRLTLAESRPMQPMDQKRIDAQRAYHEGRRLRGEGSKVSRDLALQKFEFAFPLWRELDDSESEAMTLMEIGSIYYSIGDANKYTEYETRALTIWRTLGDRGGEGETLNNLGLAHRARGETEDALVPLRQAVGDVKGEAETLNNLGSVYAEMGALQPAIRLKQEALERLQTLGDRAQEAGTFNDIGYIYDRLGQSDRALDYYTKALALNRQLGNRSGEAVNLVNIALQQEHLGDARKALDNLAPSLKLLRESGSRTAESVAL